jgi:hypothetical protein
MKTTVMTLTLILTAAPLLADSPGTQALLPPELPWQGRSLSRVAAKDDPWITPAEASNFQTTPRYQQTIAWMQRLDQATPRVNVVSIGTSPEGREIMMAIAHTEAEATPAALRAGGKPTLLIQGGIHAGEIDGKDAGLMLLRDITLGNRQRLLDAVNVLFIPVISVDGHERFSPYGRINQRGPREMGWRTNARNLNLNRDYAKLDAPELQALVRVLNLWQPDLYYDIHVTDGVDYQYDITFGYNNTASYSPHAAAWMDRVLRPQLHRDLDAWGHIPGGLVFAVDDRDLSKGIRNGVAGARYSNGYGDIRHLPTVLVENHSLKPHRQRVLGTYVLLESTLRLLGQAGRGLKEATRADRALRADPVTLSWQKAHPLPEPVAFLGVTSKLSPSPISGTQRITWTGQPVTLHIPMLVSDQPGLQVTRPRAYWIPPAWPEVIERLALHGLHLERQDAERSVALEMYRLQEPKLATEPFEGQVRVTARVTSEKRQQVFAPGSVRIPTDQPLGDLAILLLEPQAGDSFFQWGFFHETLQKTEYVEAYVMEPMAERMLAEDPELKLAFEAKLKEDPDFAANPRARLQWFYCRTPFFDEHWHLYPVGREL